MRYRNRIRLAPGVNINLSKSGISTSLGPRGANVNLGKSGTYLNTGLPGTGLYDRKQISSSKKGPLVQSSSNITPVGVKLDLDENYHPVIEIYDNDGRNITSQALINKIKRKP